MENARSKSAAYSGKNSQGSQKNKLSRAGGCVGKAGGKGVSISSKVSTTHEGKGSCQTREKEGGMIKTSAASKRAKKYFPGLSAGNKKRVGPKRSEELPRRNLKGKNRNLEGRGGGLRRGLPRLRQEEI